MQLLTKSIKNKMYKDMETENMKDTEIKVPLKLFCPWNGWEWYAYEIDENDDICFGWVKGIFPELGSFSLKELSMQVQRGVPMIERDKMWNPNTTLAEVYELTK